MAQVVSLAERLKNRREELGLSQAQAARELDVARTAYRLWEMDSATPSPDRWRLLSHWLGISVTALLLAEDLITEDEATKAGLAETDFGRGGRDWDTVGAANLGGFFQQGRLLIADGLASGAITADQAADLGFVLDRVEKDRQQDMATAGWQPASLRKDFPADQHAARGARNAVSFVAGGIPEAALETAQLLTSELVTNSVVHGPRTAGTVVRVDVEVGREEIRVAVSDTAAGRPAIKTPASESGYGLNIVDALANRWETGRDGDGNVTWFALDLRTPGN
jgi:transcriptional regulator with XRE-family HTH domain/anti-sigma regulatory factor (Ser/Thr protein kinase)